MQNSPSLSALLLAVTLFFSASAAGFNIPDGHLKSETKDATLITSPDEEKNAKNASAFEVFVDTLLGKNIDKVPEKASVNEE